MAFLYAVAGVYHFINPQFYESMIPAWLPCASVFNYAGGVAEITLAVLLLLEKTRKISAFLIVAMLIVFFLVIHVPMAVEFYRIKHPEFWISVIRLPIQFILMWWAWLYTKPMKPQA